VFDTKDVYDQNVEKWLRLEPSSLSDFTARPKVFDACGDLNGRSVLDIGCGEGYCARELKRRGAGDYLGIDLSEQMIQAARARDQVDQYGIQYLATNVVEYTPSRQFDLCVAVFLFNYLTVGDMDRVFSMVHNALVPGGEFIFSVPHPLFPFVRKQQAAPFYFESQGKNYFSNVDEQFQGQIWKQDGEPLHVQCVHKTFSDYFRALKNTGFTKIPDVEELTVTEEMVNLNHDFFSPLLNEPLHVLFKISK
jgi:SAM-dependent methyltransferase